MKIEKRDRPLPGFDIKLESIHELDNLIDDLKNLRRKVHFEQKSDLNFIVVCPEDPEMGSHLEKLEPENGRREDND